MNEIAPRRVDQGRIDHGRIDHGHIEPAAPMADIQQRMPARLRGRSHPDEFVRLFFAIEARRVAEQGRAGEPDGLVVQFIAAEPGAGTSTIAAGYARVAAAERLQPVLYVDCRGTDCPNAACDRPSLIESFLGDCRPNQAVAPVEGVPNLVRARFSADIHPMLDIGGAQIGPLLRALRRDFSVIVLDCPPASHADGTVLGAAARATRAPDLRAARETIEQLEGQVIGVVFNRARRAVPRWLDWLP